MSTTSLPRQLQAATAATASATPSHTRSRATPLSATTNVPRSVSHDKSPSQTSIAGSFLSPPPSHVSHSRRSSTETPRPSSSRARSHSSSASPYRCQRRARPQYPRDSPELHVEYILVASFHIDRGPIMEQQYPDPISGDENMLAELMLPDQTHMRSQDWTVFFLHKDPDDEDGGDDQEANGDSRQGRKDEDDVATPTPSIHGDGDGGNDDNDDNEEYNDAPPLMHVLNLVNTKQDMTAKRGAVVKAMAICTRHSFIHIYKPILLLALDEYFKHPTVQTLAILYASLNAMDLSLMPRLSFLERRILEASTARDMFLEKFQDMIAQRIAEDRAAAEKAGIDPRLLPVPKYTLPRDTHFFASKINYNGMAIPVHIPTTTGTDIVGDFSLIKLIQTFSTPNNQPNRSHPFPPHPHLTSSGPQTHPILVLLNALLTQKRVVFLGCNLPASEVAEAVLAACALASGGILRGFTRHAFPYTDLTKIYELLKVPGFVAGVTNPAFAQHPEWWDLLCDLSDGCMKISACIEPAVTTEGLRRIKRRNIYAASIVVDPSEDNAIMDDIIHSISERHGEAVVRMKCRAYVQKLIRISAVFEQDMYGSTGLRYTRPRGTSASSSTPPARPPTANSSHKKAFIPHALRGQGCVWPDEATKQRELGVWALRIEGWRNTRSYNHYVEDVERLSAKASAPTMLADGLDIQYHHDRLRTLKLSYTESALIYAALWSSVRDYRSICQLLIVAPESQSGLFYVSMGLFHPDKTTRATTAELLRRVREHDAGRHFWKNLNHFVKIAYARVVQEKQKK